MGRQGRDRACRLVGRRDRDRVGRSPLGHAQRPLRRRLAVGARGAGAVDEGGADSRPRAWRRRARTPPVPSCWGTGPGRAASARPDPKAHGSRIAVPQPDPVVSGRLPVRRRRCRCDGQADRGSYRAFGAARPARRPRWTLPIRASFLPRACRPSRHSGLADPGLTWCRHTLSCLALPFSGYLPCRFVFPSPTAPDPQVSAPPGAGRKAYRGEKCGLVRPAG